MVATSEKNLARTFGRSARTPALELSLQAVAASRAGPLREWLKSLGLGCVNILLATRYCGSAVLNDSDFKKVEELKPLFMNLMGDLVQTSKRSDISSGDSDCVKSTIQELLQISQELSSYEYLITIEKEMTDFGENSPIREVVKFAIEKSNSIL